MRIDDEGPTTRPGGTEHYTGQVWMDVLAQPDALNPISMARVYFSPGARSDWHQHPRGQVIHVTEGVGLIQERGGVVRTIRAGDTVVAAPGEWHWHGASPTTMMTMIGVQEAVPDEPVVTWGEPVSDGDYDG